MRRIWIAIVLAVGILITGAANVTARQNHPAPFRGSVHVVKSGETLWGIVKGAYPRVDPREAIDRVRRANRLPGGAIRPGQRLLLPAR